MMKLRRHARRRRVKAEMNVVPYIDVMLVLLVIFMIAAPLINQAVDIDLPEAESQTIELSSEEDMQPIVLSIDRDGLYYLNAAPNPSKPLTDLEVAEIASFNIMQHPNAPILVQGDASVSYDHIIKGIGLLQDAGAASVGLSTQPPPIVEAVQ